MRLPLFTRRILPAHFGVARTVHNQPVAVFPTGPAYLSFGEALVVFPNRKLIWRIQEEIRSGAAPEGGLTFPVNFCFTATWQYSVPLTVNGRLPKLLDLFPSGDPGGKLALAYLKGNLKFATRRLKGLPWRQLFSASHRDEELFLPPENLEELEAAGIRIRITVADLWASEELCQHLQKKAEIERTSEIEILQALANVQRRQVLEKNNQLQRAGRLEEGMNRVKVEAARLQIPLTPLAVQLGGYRALANAVASQGNLPSELLRVIIENNPAALLKAVAGLPMPGAEPFVSDREHRDQSDEEEGGDDSDED